MKLITLSHSSTVDLHSIKDIKEAQQSPNYKPLGLLHIPENPEHRATLGKIVPKMANGSLHVGYQFFHNHSEHPSDALPTVIKNSIDSGEIVRIGIERVAHYIPDIKLKENLEQLTTVRFLRTL